MQLAYCPVGKKKVVYWDTTVSGLILECFPSGNKTYALRYTDEGGTQRQLKIGRFDNITFDQAKKAARKLRSEVELGGKASAFDGRDLVRPQESGRHPP